MKITGFLTTAALLALAAGTSVSRAQQGPPPGASTPSSGGATSSAPRRRGLVPMYVESKAFPDGGIVPFKYSFAGGSTQPDFKIILAPKDTQSFAIILHDIDVGLGGPGDVLHWVAWNIPGDTTQIQQGKLPDGSVNGVNMARRNSYMGMGAPAGPRYHHYVFEFYALSSKLDLPQTASRNELLQAMQGKVIAKCAYIGRFRTEPGAARAAGSSGGTPPRGD
jgi:Raf kinase inhibitor-like YbhB/YbcL family protein